MNSRRRKFLSYYKPYTGLLVADLACALGAAVIALILPLCVRHITKDLLDVTESVATEQIYTMGLVMLVLVILHGLFHMFVSYQGHMMGALMERDMRAELFDHYQKMSFGFYDDRQTGELMNRMTNDTFWLGELCHHGPEDIVITSIKFFGTFIVLLTIDVQLTLIVFAFFPPMAAYAFYFNRQMNVALRASKDRIGDINAQAEDSLAGVRVVKSFTNAAIERAKFAIENDRFVEAKGEGYRSESYLYNGVVAFTQVFTIVIVVFGGASIAGGSLDLVDLVTFVLYIGLLVEPIRTALNFARLYQEGTTGFDRLVEVLEIEPDIEDSKQALELQHVRGNVAFRNITFGYKDDDTHVFRDLSLEIEAGEFVALVGSSGVGKTTLCSLIPRFYEVSNGSIAIDGHDVRDIRQSSLRRNIGIVQQDTYLFAGTIADNIRYGRPDATHNEVIEASRRAHAHDFIMALQDGYATDVGQRGVKLSGGQRQRLSIARVF